MRLLSRGTQLSPVSWKQQEAPTPTTPAPCLLPGPGIEPVCARQHRSGKHQFCLEMVHGGVMLGASPGTGNSYMWGRTAEATQHGLGTQPSGAALLPHP